MEFQMTRTTFLIMAALGLAGWLNNQSAWSAEQDDQALIKAMSDAKISLQQGLTTSQREGRPISAKFEMEDGKLQLSVYTEKGGKFSEVIVDHMTGAVAKTE